MQRDVNLKQFDNNYFVNYQSALHTDHDIVSHFILSTSSLKRFKESLGFTSFEWLLICNHFTISYRITPGDDLLTPFLNLTWDFITSIHTNKSSIFTSVIPNDTRNLHSTIGNLKLTSSSKEPSKVHSIDLPSMMYLARCGSQDKCSSITAYSTKSWYPFWKSYNHNFP